MPNKKIIKLSAVFKVVDGEENMLLEMAVNYDAEQSSTNGMTKLELYNSLKEMAQYQVKQVSEDAEVLDATADEVQKHAEQK